MFSNSLLFFPPCSLRHLNLQFPNSRIFTPTPEKSWARSSVDVCFNCSLRVLLFLVSVFGCVRCLPLGAVCQSSSTEIWKVLCKTPAVCLHSLFFLHPLFTYTPIILSQRRWCWSCIFVLRNKNINLQVMIKWLWSSRARRGHTYGEVEIMEGTRIKQKQHCSALSCRWSLLPLWDKCQETILKTTLDMDRTNLFKAEDSKR